MNVKKYQKTDKDKKQEKYDLNNHPIIKWLKNPNAFKFNIGDILIKKSLRYVWQPQTHIREQQWETHMVNHITNTPKRYMYVFENELGIGYIKQLTADGSDFTSNMTCVASLDPDYIKLELDPDYADSIILGTEADAQLNQRYLDIKKFRKEAMSANRKNLVKTYSVESVREWMLSLSQGERFWMGSTFDEMVRSEYEVIQVIDGPSPNTMPTLRYKEAANGYTFANGCGWFKRLKISMTKPLPLKPNI